jgi:hypothetical protein
MSFNDKLDKNPKIDGHEKNNPGLMLETILFYIQIIVNVAIFFIFIGVQIVMHGISMIKKSVDQNYLYVCTDLGKLNLAFVVTVYLFIFGAIIGFLLLYFCSYFYIPKKDEDELDKDTQYDIHQSYLKSIKEREKMLRADESKNVARKKQEYQREIIQSFEDNDSNLRQISKTNGVIIQENDSVSNQHVNVSFGENIENVEKSVSIDKSEKNTVISRNKPKNADNARFTDDSSPIFNFNFKQSYDQNSETPDLNYEDENANENQSKNESKSDNNIPNRQIPPLQKKVI